MLIGLVFGLMLVVMTLIMIHWSKLPKIPVYACTMASSDCPFCVMRNFKCLSVEDCEFKEEL